MPYHLSKVWSFFLVFLYHKFFYILHRITKHTRNALKQVAYESARAKNLGFRFFSGNKRVMLTWIMLEAVVMTGVGNTAFVDYYGGDNQAAKIGFCGPTENNGWWNPRN